MHRRRPGLPGFATAVAGREAGPARPQPVGVLQPEQPGTPALVLHPPPLGRDLAGRGIGEVAQHLPADGRVALQQPVENVHRRSIARATDGPGSNSAKLALETVES